MKRISYLFAIIAFALCSFTANAGDVKIARKICNQIRFPEWLIQENVKEEATVKLEVCEDGTINVVEVKTDDEKLKKYIEKELNGKKIEELKGRQNEWINLNITFETAE